MGPGITTSVESLDDNLVRLRVGVSAAEFEKAVDAAFRKLAREVKVPGFRPGKAPRRLLEAQFGTEVAREQALKDALPEYYEQAVVSESLDTIAPPEIDITAGEEAGDVEFEAVVEVRPEVSVSGYEGLEVTIEVPPLDEAAVDAQIDQLRNRFAELEDSAAPLTDGDYAEIDIKGYQHDEEIPGLTATDFLYEVGSASLVPKLDEELHGKRPGDILKFTDAVPERFEHGGEEAAFQVLVKDAKKKVLPDATDEWVSEVTELETLDELRADIERRMGVVLRVQAQMAVRDKVLEAAAGLVDIAPPEPLVMEDMRRRVRDLATDLGERGVSVQQWLEGTGRSDQQLLDELRPLAEQAVRADLALRGVVAAEGIEATDEEVDAEIERLAERLDEKPAKLRKELDRRGVLQAVRSDLARGKALEHLVEHARVVDAEGNPIDVSLPTDELASTETDTDRSDIASTETATQREVDE